jgi:FkbM family methyltransferase
VAGSGSHGCWLGTYERETQRLLAGLLRPGRVFYDLGANVGFYSVMAARRGAIVHAFEPEPGNLLALRRHVELNALNIVVHEAAVSDVEGRATFGGSGSTGRLGDGRIEVQTVALDSLTIPPPDVMKIDVEGAELAVLRGGYRTIARHLPAILLEPHGVIADGVNVDGECVRLLEGLGYTCTRHQRGDFLCLQR